MRNGRTPRKTIPDLASSKRVPKTGSFPTLGLGQSLPLAPASFGLALGLDMGKRLWLTHLGRWTNIGEKRLFLRHVKGLFGILLYAEKAHYGTSPGAEWRIHRWTP